MARVSCGHGALAAREGGDRGGGFAAVDEARADLPMIEASLERLGEPPQLRGLFLHNVGVLELRAGAPEAARDAYRSALEIKTSTLAEDDPEILWTEAALAIAQAELAGALAAAGCEAPAEVAALIDAARSTLDAAGEAFRPEREAVDALRCPTAR